MIRSQDKNFFLADVQDDLKEILHKYFDDANAIRQAAIEILSKLDHRMVTEFVTDDVDDRFVMSVEDWHEDDFK